MERIGWLLGICLAVEALTASAQETAPAAAQVAPVVEQKQEMPFLGGFLKETRIVYPLQVGTWRAQGEHLYENQAYGVSVRYQAADAADGWIDVYFYPAGVLSAQEFREVAQIERDNIGRAQRMAGMPAPDMGELQAFSFDGARSAMKGWSADLGMTLEGTQYSSALTLLLDRLYFIKGRYSVPAAHRARPDARKALEDFMAQLDPQLAISSSGACWMPLPIERLADGQPDPTRTLARSGRPARHFLLDDRVLSRDPDNPDAFSLMLVGMALDHRAFAGCDGSQPANPEVPDGRREIRLEYRAPGDLTSPTLPLRPARVQGS
jgi:hypothetical protein